MNSHVLTLITAPILAATLALTGNPTVGPRATPTPAAAYLAAHPGGHIIDDNNLSYGPVTVTVTPPVQPLIYPDCPAGWFCFYQYTNYGYPRGKLSSCGWQNLATWGWQNRIQSAYYNLLNGAVAFINHIPGTNPAYDQTLFTISVTQRAIPDVYPYRNMADYVYRYC
jgi:hypothetical protein